MNNSYPLTSIILGKPNVLNADSNLNNGTFSGNIYVKNLNPTKTVKIVNIVSPFRELRMLNMRFPIQLAGKRIGIITMVIITRYTKL